MNITGIITEYNPFHLGHLHHLQECKKDTNCDGVICVMSGNFVQRGMPAIIDKWERAKIAVKNGVDLVVELPLIFSTSSAETFAYGAVALLEKTRVVNNLYFGSEHGDVLDLNKIASVIIKEPLEYKNILKKELSKGVPYHYARLTSLKNYFSDINLEEIISSSNNILGIEYLKALKRHRTHITPLTIKRDYSDYNSEKVKKGIASATAIRTMVKNNKNVHYVVPYETYELLDEEINNGRIIKDLSVFEKEIIYTLRKMTLSEIANLPDVSEGLENRIKMAANKFNNLNDLILNIKSKRYTQSRIQRILLYALIGISRKRY